MDADAVPAAALVLAPGDEVVCGAAWRRAVRGGVASAEVPATGPFDAVAGRGAVWAGAAPEAVEDPAVAAGPAVPWAVVPVPVGVGVPPLVGAVFTGAAPGCAAGAGVPARVVCARTGPLASTPSAASGTAGATDETGATGATDMAGVVGATGVSWTGVVPAVAGRAGTVARGVPAVPSGAEPPDRTGAEPPPRETAEADAEPAPTPTPTPTGSVVVVVA
ncbi:hypothetical protein ABTY23_31950, partial [Streptomyces sp. NPDC096068]